MDSVFSGGVARPVQVFVTPNGRHTALGWAGKTADQLLSFDWTKSEAVRLKGQVTRLLSLGFEEVLPGMSETQLATLTQQVWAQIIRVAAPTEWAHWFNTEVVRSQMLQIIKSNLSTFSNDKLRAT